MEFFSQLLLVLLVFVLTYTFTKTTKNNISKSNHLVPPEPPGSLPFIGHLHHLRGEAPVARILGTMADKYGPIYSLRLGSRRAVVVSRWEMVKECFTTNDRNFATRPSLAVTKYMGYNGAVFALAPYGPYWRNLRKMVTLELLTSQRLDKSKTIRSTEVDHLVKDLHSNLTSVVNMTERFEHMTFNIIVRMLAGKRFSIVDGEEEGEDRKVKEAIKKMLYLSGVFVVSDVMPWLEWLDIGGHVKAMKGAAKELDGVLGKWVDEHVDKTKLAVCNEKEEDFMDVMISKLSQDAQSLAYGRETIIKATTLILILTGSESTAETLTWALSLLLNNHRSLKILQDELDVHVGRERWVEESDIKNLRYLQATVKETLRMYPPGPLAGPHEAMEDCYIGGYRITKGTRLIVNLWKLHRDSQVWSNPHEFRPERFLEEHSNISYHGQDFEYIPFSSGRRMCPASTFALQVIHLTLARLIQGFNVSTPMGKPVDMSEGVGIALPKIQPLEVILNPQLRLHPQLYENLS